MTRDGKPDAAYLPQTPSIGQDITGRMTMAVTANPGRDQAARLVLADRALREPEPAVWLGDMLDVLGLR